MWTLYKPGIAPPASCDAAAATIWEYYQTLKPKELEDVKVVLLWAVGPGWVHTKNPITKVSELQGLKIRSTGAFIDAVKMVGGEPIGMPMGDVYLAAQKGSIDAAITPPEALETWKFCEIWKYSTFLPTFYSHFQYLVMNLDKWNSLPKDLQDAFDSVAEEAVKEAGQIWTYFNQQGIDYAESQTGGHEFIYFSPEEEAKLLEAIKPVRDNYIDELNAQGLPGEEIVNLANEIMSKNNEKTYEEWKP
jgi:TRAP-type C4-dicarboxylate transport system substrate-binding protein